MTDTDDIVLVKANVRPIRNRTVFWLLSRNQVEHIIQDRPVCPVPLADSHIRGISAWQGLVLPVISLERYFRFAADRDLEIKRRVVVKTTTIEQPKTVTRLLVDVAFDVRIRPLPTECEPVRMAAEQLAARGLLGVFEWADESLLLLPDLTKIASATRTAA